MHKIICYTAGIVLILSCLLPNTLAADNLDALFNLVEKLNVQRSGYTLGKVLTAKQLEIAASASVNTASPGTFKFRDKALFVVAQEKSNRVLVIYEQFETASQEKVQNIVGELYMNFDEPTVSAHDKVVYWAWTENGKVSSQKFNTAKDEKKKLNILVTVKFVSDVKIMEKKENASAKGQAYYIISSDPVLKRIAGSDS